jgi:hypothetical protein
VLEFSALANLRKVQEAWVKLQIVLSQSSLVYNLLYVHLGHVGHFEKARVIITAHLVFWRLCSSGFTSVLIKLCIVVLTKLQIINVTLREQRVELSNWLDDSSEFNILVAFVPLAKRPVDTRRHNDIVDVPYQVFFPSQLMTWQDEGLVIYHIKNLVVFVWLSRP